MLVEFIKPRERLICSIAIINRAGNVDLALVHSLAMTLKLILARGYQVAIWIGTFNALVLGTSSTPG
jgi:hypothetical protein